MKKPELLSPVGDLKKLPFSLNYGADAVYAGTNEFGLRYNKNFAKLHEIEDIIKLTHSQGKKIFITANIFMHNTDIELFRKNIDTICETNPDALIVSDPGAIDLIRQSKNIPLHLSTQSNTTNYQSLLFWEKNGIKRGILARELQLKEIYEIRKKLRESGSALEIESFVHGAMCISYSGRCLLSLYMTSPELSRTEGKIRRDANRGMCVHPCRWEYKLEEKSREGEEFDIIQDKGMTYILSSKDLCMLRYIPLLMFAGLDSLKIEGRMKSELYTSATTLAYRKGIDKAYSLFDGVSEKEKIHYINHPDQLFLDFPEWDDFSAGLADYLDLFSHRPYTTGFYFIKNRDDPALGSPGNVYSRNYLYLGYSCGNCRLGDAQNRKGIDDCFPFRPDNNKFIDDFILRLDRNIDIRDRFSLQKKYYLNLIYCKNKIETGKTVKIFGQDGISEISFQKALSLSGEEVAILKHSNYYFVISADPLPAFSLIFGNDRKD